MSRKAAAITAAIAIATIARGTSPAFADARTEAVVLFDEGIKDMRAGRIEQACSKLAASLSLVKDSGTKGALARCHGLAGRVATAWVMWRELSDTAPTAVLRTDAAAQAQRLEPRLPRYTITIQGPDPKLVVEVNGRRISNSTLVAVPIDPGKVTVAASGRDGDRIVTETWARNYVAALGETLSIDIPPLGPRPGPGGVMPVDPAAQPVGPPDDPHAAGGRAQRVVAVVLGIAAVGAATGGTLYGLSARGKRNDASELCGGAIERCDPAQVAGSQQLVDDARDAATRSTILFAAAGATALAAIIVWATAPSLERTGVSIAPYREADAFGVALGARF